ncbi:MAG TPA: HEAT repeat domain-containing protein [Labilithrix sp.]|nr:HEAT repeat domain-containing protein [Labilithrix sp.]
MQPRSVLGRVVGAALVVATLMIAGHSVAHDRELTESADFRVRVQAALRLARAGAASRGDLEAGLADAHPAVRIACVTGLATIGDPASIPALERAMRSETYGTVKTSMNETIDKLRASAAVKSSSPPRPTSLAGAHYVVQLGAMRNMSGVRSSDLDGVMRQAARAKAGAIKGAVVIDGSDPNVVKKATEKRIPVLQLDGNLTNLTQVIGTDGSTVVSAKVNISVRKLPGQTLKGTVSGKASASHGARATERGLQELQDRVVGGAVESAMGSMSQELALFSK